MHNGPGWRTSIAPLYTIKKGANLARFAPFFVL